MANTLHYFRLGWKSTLMYMMTAVFLCTRYYSIAKFQCLTYYCNSFWNVLFVKDNVQSVGHAKTDGYSDFKLLYLKIGITLQFAATAD